MSIVSLPRLAFESSAAGIVLAYSGALGAYGILSFTAGSVLASFATGVVRRESDVKVLGPQAATLITEVALSVFASSAAGWLSANTFGFPISFGISLLSCSTGPLLLVGSVLSALLAHRLNVRLTSPSTKG